ncbi:MAG TPA: zinc ribbon domain-containing protein [Mycobacteriales bacterium]|jgi:uncharacterized OB-fold protein|nr:zinc ribbon domain-containing protein [Mycobacteriales bacterium]
MTSPAALAPFDAAVLRRDGEGVRLIGSACQACDATYFPARATCASCGTATTATDLPEAGVVYAVTTSAWPIAGLTPPVTVVQVDLAAGLRVQAVSVAPLVIGERARVVPITVPAADGEQLGYAFAAEVGPDA